MLVAVVWTFCQLCLISIVSSIATNDSMSDLSCPTWMYRINGSSQCTCGVDLNKAVLCNNSTQEIQVRRCHMVTFDHINKEVIVGYSLYGCLTKYNVDTPYQLYIPVPSDTLQVNLKMCGSLNRDGRLCGACKNGYWPLVLSYKLNCKMCLEGESRQNWFYFIAFALIPITMFYVFIMLFKFNANAPSLHGFIIWAQLLTQTFNTKTLYEQFEFSHGDIYKVGQVILTLYSICNLNFFREFTPDICLRISTMCALSLEYVVAFYPMFLIVITFIAVKLHSRGFRIIIMIWTPFQRCSSYVRKNWNMKSYLIDAFATFLLLSYNRLLDISFSLLMYVTAYNSRGEPVGRYLYYDSSKEFFGKEHLPYGILAALVLLFFNVVPLLLLLFYPMNWFQRCLNCTRLNCFALQTFVDAFTGCYKDGTEPRTRDCRYFAALYLLLRFANCLCIICTYDSYYGVVFTIVLLHYGILIICAQPYRSKFSQHNTTTTVFLMLGICLACGGYSLRFCRIIRPQSSTSLIIFLSVIIVLPQLYVAFLLLRFVCRGVPWGKCCCVSAKFPCLNELVSIKRYNSI